MRVFNSFTGIITIIVYQLCLLVVVAKRKKVAIRITGTYINDAQMSSNSQDNPLLFCEGRYTVAVSKKIHETIKPKMLDSQTDTTSEVSQFNFPEECDCMKKVAALGNLALHLLMKLEEVEKVNQKKNKVRWLWSQILLACNNYLKMLGESDWMKHIRDTAGELARDRDIKTFEELQAKKKGKAMTPVEVLYYSGKFPNFCNLVPNSLTDQLDMNLLKLYFMLSVSSLHSTCKYLGFLAIMIAKTKETPRPKFYNGFECVCSEKKTPDVYCLCLEEKDIDALRDNVDLSVFWRTVRGQVLLIGSRILRLVTGMQNNPRCVYRRMELKILYDVDRNAANDVFKFTLFNNDEKWGDCLVELGLADMISILCIEVCSYKRMADTIPEQLKKLKAIKELGIELEGELDSDITREIDELKKKIGDCKLILHARVEDCYNIVKEINSELYGIRWKEEKTGFSHWRSITNIINKKEYEDVRFKLCKFYPMLIEKMKGIRCMFRRFSIHLYLKNAFYLSSLFIYVMEIFSYMDRLYAHGEWFSATPVPDAEDIKWFKEITYFECTCQNLMLFNNYIGKGEKERKTLNPPVDTEESALKTLTLYKVILTQEDANRISNISLTDLYLFACPDSTSHSLLAIILNLDSKLSKSIRKLTVRYWYPTPEDVKAVDNFIKQKEGEVVITVEYIDEEVSEL